MRYLGINYENGTGVEKDECKAIEWYEKAADLNDAIAMRCLGVNYENGTGVEKDECKAVEWYEKAANLNDAIAIRCLGVNYENGIGVEKDEQKAIECYQRAAQMNEITAMYNLGYCYYVGIGTPRNYDMAFVWFTKASNLGSSQAALLLGKCYEKGYGTEVDIAHAIKIYEKIAEDGTDNGEADFLLASIYDGESESGLVEDQKKAFHHFEKAYFRGWLPAVRYLARCYELGIGVRQNKKKAFSILNSCIMDNGTSYNVLQLYELFLGVYYEYGIGVDKDPHKAVEIYRKHLLSEDEDIVSFARWYLGVCYYHGDGVSCDKEKALEFFYGSDLPIANVYIKAIVEKDASACYGLNIFYRSNSTPFFKLDYQRAFQFLSLANKYTYNPSYIFELANLYLCGRGVAKNLKKAYQLYVESNLSDASQIIGEFHLFGHCIPRNYKKAISIFNEGVDLGNSRAMVCLGLCYLNGYGVVKDVNHALDLFKKASRTSSWYGEHGCGIAALIILAFPSLFIDKQSEALSQLQNLRSAQNSFWNSFYDDFCGIILQNDINFLLKIIKFRLSGIYLSKFSYQILRIGIFVQWILIVSLGYIKATLQDQNVSKKDLKKKIETLKDELFRTNRELWYQEEIIKIKDERIECLTKEIDFYRLKLQPLVQSLDTQVGEIRIHTQSSEENLKTLSSFTTIDLVQILHENKTELQKSIEETTDKVKIEQLVSECLNSITSHFHDHFNISNELVKHERKHLLELFKENWNKLLPSSQISLISAGVLWKSCADITNMEFDFSGVCILVTSALEAELKKYFFEDFQKYLLKKYGAPDSINWEQTFSIWPDELLSISKIDFENILEKYKKNTKKCQKPIISLRDMNCITIGSLPYLFGLKVSNHSKYSKEERAQRLSVLRRKLNEYLLTITDSTCKEPISLFLDNTDGESFVERCERIREQYRNPSAHTDIISKDIAKACYQEIIGEIANNAFSTDTTSLLVKLVSMVI